MALSYSSDAQHAAIQPDAELQSNYPTPALYPRPTPSRPSSPEPILPCLLPPNVQRFSKYKLSPRGLPKSESSRWRKLRDPTKVKESEAGSTIQKAENTSLQSASGKITSQAAQIPNGLAGHAMHSTGPSPPVEPRVSPERMRGLRQTVPAGRSGAPLARAEIILTGDSIGSLRRPGNINYFAGGPLPIRRHTEHPQNVASGVVVLGPAVSNEAISTNQATVQGKGKTVRLNMALQPGGFGAYRTSSGRSGFFPSMQPGQSFHVEESDHAPGRVAIVAGGIRGPGSVGVTVDNTHHNVDHLEPIQ